MTLRWERTPYTHGSHDEIADSPKGGRYRVQGEHERFYFAFRTRDTVYLSKSFASFRTRDTAYRSKSFTSFLSAKVAAQKYEDER